MHSTFWRDCWPKRCGPGAGPVVVGPRHNIDSTSGNAALVASHVGHHAWCRGQSGILTPGEFVARALDANLGAVPNALDTAVLHWRLYAALCDPALLTEPALAELHAYLADGDLFKPWTLAEALSAAFEKYQAWRCDWLLRWEAGADPDDPQAILWRHSVNGATHRARRIHDYLNRYGSGTAPQGLPARLFIFATLNISPDVLRVLATQAQVGTLHFYLPTPTKEYWGDAQPFTQRLHQPTDCVTQTGENRLLHAWGAAGRDFMTVLGSYEVVHPSGEITAYDDPEQRPGTTLDEGGLRDSLLQRLHADLFHNRSAPVPAPLPAPRLEDPSLQFHACHTRLRELQVLHDRLRALLEPNSPEGQRFNPPLQPREIAVLAPDIDLYIPYLEAVFGGHAHSDPLPYTLADASPLIDEPLAEVFLRLLDLPVSRFGLHEILDLLASLPMATLAGFDTQTLEILRSWLTAMAHAGDWMLPTVPNTKPRLTTPTPGTLHWTASSWVTPAAQMPILLASLLGRIWKAAC